MSDNTLTIVGNVTRDPELKFLNSGQAWVKLSVAVNKRWKNRQTDEWNEKTSFFEVGAYGSLAENVANSITMGTRVTVTGQLEQRSWETENGDKRSVVEINAEEISPSLKWATAIVTRTPRENTPSYQSPASAPQSYQYADEEF
jgi:single-strand DNA-binding protein